MLYSIGCLVLFFIGINKMLPIGYATICLIILGILIFRGWEKFREREAYWQEKEENKKCGFPYYEYVIWKRFFVAVICSFSIVLLTIMVMLIIVTLR